MKYSLNIGRPFGIKIAIHWTFLLLILWAVITFLPGYSFETELQAVTGENFLFVIGVFVVIGARMEYTQVKYPGVHPGAVGTA